jgi:acetyl-CoA acetyltransferase
VDLAVEACLAALDDAGLGVGDVDGMAAYVPDQGSALVLEVQDAMGLELDWWVGCVEGASQIEAILTARAAVATGRARHVLAFHSSAEGSIRARLGRGGSQPGTAKDMPARAPGNLSWLLPFGAPSAANMVAMHARRHFHEYGTTREQLGWIPVVQRANAALHPHAVYREPLDLDAYVAARPISEPLGLFDCDTPVDFAAAVVVSSSETSADLRKTPLAFEAVGTSRRVRPRWDQNSDLTTTMALHDASAAMWSRTDLRPADVDVAAVYDGFSFIALMWLEALGFCPKGEGGSFVEGGSRIARDGALPINTGGGQLSGGRMHAWGHVVELCTQLWGEAGERQVAGPPEVALLASGGGLSGSAALLTRA